MDNEKYKHKYNKYKTKYLQLKGGNRITIDDIKNDRFIDWFKAYTSNFFENTEREFGGLITINNTSYEVTMSHHYNPKDGMMLWSSDMLESISDNQLMWHTHNIDRVFVCEPPSAADITISLKLAKLGLYPYGIAIHTSGMWVYKIKKPLHKVVVENFEREVGWIGWMISALDNLFCNSDPDVVQHYSEDDLARYGLGKIKSTEEYLGHVKRLLGPIVFMDFISF